MTPVLSRYLCSVSSLLGSAAGCCPLGRVLVAARVKPSDFGQRPAEAVSRAGPLVFRAGSKVTAAGSFPPAFPWPCASVTPSAKHMWEQSWCFFSRSHPSGDIVYSFIYSFFFFFSLCFSPRGEIKDDEQVLVGGGGVVPEVSLCQLPIHFRMNKSFFFFDLLNRGTFLSLT